MQPEKRNSDSTMDAKEYFDQVANTWDEKYLTPSLSIFLEKLTPQFGIEQGQDVLDVGTGTGVLIPYLVKAVGSSGSVTAIDYSQNMVEVCKTKYSQLGNVSIKVGNIEEDIFMAETFDAVVCFGMFPHLEKKKKALQNINGVLKRNGKLIIAHALSSKELITHHKKASKYVAHAILPTKLEMIQLLEQTGFTDISIKDDPGLYMCKAYKSASGAS